MHDQNIMISDEQSGSWGIQKLLHMLRTSSEVQTAELGLCVNDRAAAVRLLLPAGVWEALHYTCILLGNICEHNAKGGWGQRLTVKPDHKQYR